VYGLVYLGIIFVWPYSDPRFFVPVIPILIGWAILGIEAIPRRYYGHTAAKWALILSFTAFGVLSLYYNTRLSYAGANFPELYGRGCYQKIFKIASEPATSKGVDASDLQLIRVIKRYDTQYR
jgi:hypothetical protein